MDDTQGSIPSALAEKPYELRCTDLEADPRKLVCWFTGRGGYSAPTGP